MYQRDGYSTNIELAGVEMKEVPVDNLKKFDEVVESLRPHNPIWRGQANSSWSLQTSLERFLKDEGVPEADSYPFRMYFNNLQMICHFLGKFSGLDLTLHKTVGPHAITVSGFREASKYWDELVLLRHHGFPSFWLDWTQSPWIALYFAFEPANDCERAVFVQTLNNQVPAKTFEKRPFESTYFIHTRGTFAKERRHSMQQCYLSCSYRNNGIAHDSLQPKPIENNGVTSRQIVVEQDIVPFEKAIKETGRENEFTKIILPSKIRMEVLRRLAEYNVNHFTLFGSPEAAIRTAALNSFVLNYLTL